MTNLSINSPRRLLTKRKMPLSIRFALRPGYDTVQIRITINGKEGSPFSTLPSKTALYATGITWNQRQQRASGRSEPDRLFNLEIDNIRTSINAIYDRQKAAGFELTPKSIQQEFQTGKFYEASPVEVELPKWSAMDCYQAYLAELASGGLPEKKLVQTTLNKWQYGLTYLKRYVEQTQDKDPLSDGPAEGLTLFWGKSYHRWLMKEGPMAADSATRYVNRLIEAITHIAETGAIKQNPLATLKLPRDKTKDVYWLEPHHLEKFWQLEVRPDLEVACWWMGLIFLTGLDYPDAVRYVQNRAVYERMTKNGPKIVICRSKPPRTECHIPMLPALLAWLEHVPAGEPPKDGYIINDTMKIVEVLIGFDRRLTCKIGRKTAGAIFQSEFEDLATVSRIMGHSSVSITERYYVKTTGYTVDKAMQKYRLKSSSDQPFTHIYKAS